MRILTLVIALVIFSTVFTKNQPYNGLDFTYITRKHESRTSLNLTSSGKLFVKDNYRLSFELSFSDPDEYGIILNIFNQKNFVRLIYAPKNDSASFYLIVNNRPVRNKITISKSILTRGNWLTLDLLIDQTKNNCTLILNKTNKSEVKIDKMPIANTEVIFGEFLEENVPMTDITCFRLRNVKVYEYNNKLKHFWKLDESGGEIAKDAISNNNATVHKPNWMILNHFKFVDIAKLGPFSGASKEIIPSISYDRVKNRLLITGNNFIYYFDLNKRKYSKEDYNIPLKQICYRTIYDEKKDKLYAQYTGGGIVSIYNEKDKTWSDLDSSIYHQGKYYGSSLFINPLNGELCMLGGYGYFLTRKELQKYDFNLKKWSKIRTKGDSILTFMSAMFGPKNDMGDFFIMGGKGNESGKQEEKHRWLKDLYLLRMKDTSIMKISEVNNSIDTTFYSSTIKYDSTNNQILFWTAKVLDDSKKLMTINKYDLVKKTFYVVSESFETHYNFLPPVYYDLTNNEMLIMQLKLEGKDSLYVYIKTLNYPPLTKEEFELLPKQEASINYFNKYKYITVVMLFITIGLATYHLKKKNKSLFIKKKTIDVKYIEENTPSSIYLYGNFKVFDKNSVDITKEFAPKIKQLFILLLTKSYNGPNHGITTEALTTYLWPDLNTEKSKNNRNVSIKKLRSILSKLDGIQLIFANNTWNIKIDHNVYCDYVLFTSLMSNGYILANIAQIKEILSRGELVLGESYEWFDGQKAQLIEASITKLIKSLTSKVLDPEIKINVADCILLLDSVNEIGLTVKINSLVELGNHSRAKSTFDLFRKEYYRLYAEEYKSSYTELIKSHSNR